MKRVIGVLILLVCSTVGSEVEQRKQQPSNMNMNSIAQSYVKLVLSIGQHDRDYVDAYYGPVFWKLDAQSQKKPLQQIKIEAIALQDKLKASTGFSGDELLQLRYQYLTKQISAMIARTEMLNGRKFTFEEETRALYDVIPPQQDEKYFQSILSEIEKLLPGEGPVAERYVRFRDQFVIPANRLDAVFSAAIAECRKRTKERIRLPERENFRVEYVKDKTWSAYNWYQGNFQSLIQVNTDLPVYADRAIDLAAHEGYPGHHVYNALLEDRLVHARGWLEFTVYPLFSPQSLIAEGTANFGIEVAFPGKERIEFEKKTLFPLAGLDPSQTDTYYALQRLIKKLDYVSNLAARRYLNGEINRDQAAQLLVTYGLMSPERGKQRVGFIDQYRSYVINYNLGEDMIRKYIEFRGGTDDRPDVRWKEFEKLISSPRLPSGLHTSQ